MSLKKPQLTKAGLPRKRKPGAGRPSLGKVKMTVHILPATRQSLGDKPGEVLDAHFGGAKTALLWQQARRKTQPKRKTHKMKTDSMLQDAGAACQQQACSALRVCDCGETPEALYGWLNADYVACPHCGAQTDEYEMHTGEAGKAWNERNLLPAPNGAGEATASEKL